jgi:hypothetical protein
MYPTLHEKSKASLDLNPPLVVWVQWQLLHGGWRFTSIYTIMVYSHVLGMLLWRRVLDKDCQLKHT